MVPITSSVILILEGRVCIIKSTLQLRNLRLNGGLNDLPKITKAASGGARASFNLMSNDFSTLLNGLL